MDDYPTLREGLVLLGGEARFRHLYCRAGAAEDVDRRPGGPCSQSGPRSCCATTRPPGAGSASSPPACGRGSATWSWPAAGDWAVVSTVDFPHETTLVGMHGSLTSAEMLVPLLVC